MLHAMCIAQRSSTATKKKKKGKREEANLGMKIFIPTGVWDVKNSILRKHIATKLR